MAVVEEFFGKSPEGQEAKMFTLSNEKGMKVCVTDIGASLARIWVPDAQGNIADVVLGMEKAEDYWTNESIAGIVVGPHANRIANASFELDGVTYQLDPNENGNNLHSHFQKGYQKRIWNSSVGENSVTFSLEDEDGCMGFPGNKKIQVTYSLNEENELRLHYCGTSDKRTVLNLTNHAYFNLDGHESGSMEEHELWIGASCYTPVAAKSIPTGEIASVKGTPMDFTEMKKVGLEINADFEQLKITGGYDHNWVVDDWDETLRHIATVKGPKSGRIMKVYTTLPGVQFYAGNFISQMKAKDGANYDKRHGLCLETQYFPDTVHHDNFPSCIFGGDKEYDSVTVFRFE